MSCNYQSSDTIHGNLSRGALVSDCVFVLILTLRRGICLLWHDIPVPVMSMYSAAAYMAGAEMMSVRVMTRILLGVGTCGLNIACRRHRTREAAGHHPRRNCTMVVCW